MGYRGTQSWPCEIILAHIHMQPLAGGFITLRWVSLLCFGFHADVDGICFKQPLMGASKSHENNASVRLATSQGVRLASGPKHVPR